MFHPWREHRVSVVAQPKHTEEKSDWSRNTASEQDERRDEPQIDSVSRQDRHLGAKQPMALGTVN